MHVVDLSQNAAVDGYPFVIAVGGEGTENEVLNGLFSANFHAKGETSLGISPVGGVMILHIV